MTLKQSIEANNEFFPCAPRDVLAGRLNSDNSRGRGRNAKRRAGDIANQMLESDNFQHPDWHRLIRYCEGLDNSTTY